MFRKSAIAGMLVAAFVALAACTPVPQGAVMQSADSDSKVRNPSPGTLNDTPSEAAGRRTLSTAFVRVGPDGLLTVKLKDGKVLVLRNVAMRPKDYCGETVVGGSVGTKFCGGYADVASARPGGSPVTE